MKYCVHRFDINMRRDAAELEGFLNSLEGEVAAIIPNVGPAIVGAAVDFVLVVKRVRDEWSSLREKTPEDIVFSGL